jgi:hypothetical protein
MVRRKPGNLDHHLIWQTLPGLYGACVDWRYLPAAQQNKNLPRFELATDLAAKKASDFIDDST